MSISEKDIKTLWGRAAGRCSKPGCEIELTEFLGTTDPTIIGEMAHIIARRPKGPRGVAGGGLDIYDNLILLCPNHHTEIDKAPKDTFPESLVREWKRMHESLVTSAFLSPVFVTRQEMAATIARLLVKNKHIWLTYGPDSKTAKLNPISNSAYLWSLRKLSTIAPNNRKIMNMIDRNIHLIDLSDLEHFTAFNEHAIGFEHNCYVRTEDVPRFPEAFGQVVHSYANAE